MVVGIISDERRNFSVSVKIYWLKREFFPFIGNDINIQGIHMFSIYICFPSVSEIKLEITNGVLWYRFQRTNKILRLCENIFTKKENFVRSSEYWFYTCSQNWIWVAPWYDMLHQTITDGGMVHVCDLWHHLPGFVTALVYTLHSNDSIFPG